MHLESVTLEHLGRKIGLYFIKYSCIWTALVSAGLIPTYTNGILEMHFLGLWKGG